MPLQIALLFLQVIGIPAYLVAILWRGRETNKLNWWLKAGLSVTFLGFALRGYFYSEAPVRLQLPLRDGRYYVGQGGNSIMWCSETDQYYFPT